MRKPASRIQKFESHAVIYLPDGSEAVIDLSDVELLCGKAIFRCRDHVVVRVGGKTTYLHRYLLAAPADVLVDHRDGDPMNNRRANLRASSHRLNTINRHVRSDQRSKYRGVSWDSERSQWAVHVGKRRVGRFFDEVEAARCYDYMARQIYGEHGRYNFPRDGEESAMRES